MLAIAVTVGLALLLVGGVVQLSRADLTGPGAERDQLVSTDVTTFGPADYRDPARILEDGGKLRNAFVVVLEATSVALAVWLAVHVLTAPGISPAFEAVLVATLLVGATLVGRGIYVRLGLHRPTLESVADYRDSLAATFDDATGEDFAAVHAAMWSARAGEDADEVTAGVLAAARNGRSLADLAEWGEYADVGTAADFEDRADRLAEAGIVEREDGRIHVADRLADADDDQLATVATTVLG